MAPLRDDDQERVERLAVFIRREVARDPRRNLDLDTQMVSSGLVDSMSLIQILAFIEDEFGIVIPDEAATAEAMDTLRSILGLVRAYETPARPESR